MLNGKMGFETSDWFCTHWNRITANRNLHEGSAGRNMYTYIRTYLHNLHVRACL